MKEIYNIYSFIISLVIIIYCSFSFYTKNYAIIIASIIAFVISMSIQFFTYGIDEFKRPKDADKCFHINTENDSDKSGMPSGHVATTTAFFTTLFLMKGDYTLKSLIIYNIPILLMCISRYSNSCHTIWQIFWGYVLGLGVALEIHYKIIWFSS